MTCSRCGCSIPPDQAVWDLQNVCRPVRDRSPGSLRNGPGAPDRQAVRECYPVLSRAFLAPVLLCPECAGRRVRLLRFCLILGLAIVSLPVLIVLAVQLLLH